MQHNSGSSTALYNMHNSAIARAAGSDEHACATSAPRNVQVLALRFCATGAAFVPWDLRFLYKTLLP
jgi:hypothetical protein